MLGKNRWLIEDTEFIISDFAKFQSIIKDDFKKIPKEDLWYTVPAAQMGEWIIGQAAGKRLVHLAEEAGRRANLTLRVDQDTLIRPMRKLFSKRFLQDRVPVEIKHVDKLLNTVGKEAQKECKNTIHIIPCHLMRSAEPSEFLIGPVRFRNRKATRRLLLKNLANLPAKDPVEKNDHTRSLLKDAIVYYRNFDWSAEVRIENCDDKISEILAQRTVISALDCIHLIFGARSTDQMRVGGPALRKDDRARLFFSMDNPMSASLSMSNVGQTGFNSSWAKCFERNDFKEVLDLCGVALEAAINPDLRRPLSSTLANDGALGAC